MNTTEPRGAREIFRPAPGLRVLAAAMCLLSLAVWLTVLATYPTHRSIRRIAAASILAFPCLLGATVLFRRILTQPEQLASVSLFRAKRLRWLDVSRIDVRRGSFVIESNVGPVSASLIDPRERDRLLRIVVERAVLTRATDELPWGIDARYVPRRQDIGFAEFVPHHKRKGKTDKTEQ